jgi:hypothetical protein
LDKLHAPSKWASYLILSPNLFVDGNVLNQTVLGLGPVAASAREKATVFATERTKKPTVALATAQTAAVTTVQAATTA